MGSALISIRADTKQLLLLNQKLHRFEAELANREKPLKRIKQRQNDVWMQSFRSNGSRYGGWAALSPYTVADRRRLGFAPGPTLQRTGRLMRWVDTKNKEGIVAAESIHWEFHASGAKDGSYAVFHNEGYHSWAYDVGVPSRKIWDLNEKDEKLAEAELNKWVKTIVTKYLS